MLAHDIILKVFARIGVASSALGGESVRVLREKKNVGTIVW